MAKWEKISLPLTNECHPANLAFARFYEHPAGLRDMSQASKTIFSIYLYSVKNSSLTESNPSPRRKFSLTKWDISGVQPWGMAGGSVGIVWRKGWLEKSAKGVLEEMEYCGLARKLAKNNWSGWPGFADPGSSSTKDVDSSQGIR